MDSTAATPESDVETEDGPNAPVSILLVDDDANNLLALESILDLPEYRLVRAQSSDLALLALMEGEFAAIVLDVQMPDMSGIDLARLIKQRKRTQTIPIIFLTAHYREDEHAVLAYDVGAVDYLTKPVHPAVLRSKVGVFVDLFRKTRALAAMNAELEAKNTALERESAERALRLEAEAGRAEAEAANAAKDRFLAMLSHELRTPLSPVLHSVALLEETPDSVPLVKECVETIRRNVQLEARLIDDLLDLSRIKNGKLTLHFKSADAHELLHGAIQICRPGLDSKHLELSVNLDADSRTLRADPARLQQVFWNLLSNAIKFTPEGGQLFIQTTNTSEGKFLVEISDTGTGIAPDKQAIIFDAFEQAASDSAGLGLGLAICKALTEFHGGQVGARSAGLGHGATFWVELPVTVEAIISIESPTVRSKPTRESPLRLLVVEDHLDTAITLCRLLKRRGYIVEAANTCKAALELFQEHQFDILVTDIGLPDGDGAELYQSLKLLPGHENLLGIALSGFGMDDDLARTQRAGFSDHLTKPVDISSLQLSLESLDLTSLR